MAFYNRKLAVEYAEKWALKRNQAYLNFDNLGGDCTNFISQCIFAGIKEMNYSKYGWYYINGNNRSASWTGVEFLYKFLVSNKSVGPKGRLISKDELEIGDIIQLSFDGVVFGHSLIVSNLDDGIIKICCHTIDSLNRPLDTYIYQMARYIKIF